MAASLGGIEALGTVLSALPAYFSVPIIIVQHLSPRYKSRLAEIMNQRTSLSVEWAQSRTVMQAGHVYIAPPNFHVIVNTPGILTLAQTPEVQFTRPAANPLFESVAACYRERALAVVLTGGGSDGARGVQAIRRNGGRVIVQDWRTAQAFSMPAAAMKADRVDFSLSLRAIAPALISLVMVEGASQFFLRPAWLLWTQRVHISFFVSMFWNRPIKEQIMCRNIKPLFNFDPPATEEEIRAASLQFVRKLSGFNKPSKANEEAFNRAIEEIATAAQNLLNSLETNAEPRNREIEAQRAKARSAERFKTA
jgi:two-component system chemotaxis response regulator CheB